MAAVNPKTNASLPDQIKKLEAELKGAFQEGRFEDVRKKAEELKKVDPQNRLAQRIVEKAGEAEAAAIKKANEGKITALEVKLDQAFKVGNLAVVTQLVEEVKKLDPKNKKAMKVEGVLANARASLDVEMAKEKLRKLMAELAALVSKPDWNGVEKKANEILAIDRKNSVAMGALAKAAKAKGVAVSPVAPAAKPALEEKPGFFARLFGGKKEVPVAQKPTVSQPVPAKVTSTATVVAPAKLIPVPMQPKAVPKMVPASVVATPVKPMGAPVAVASQAKKPEEVKKAPGLFSRLFGSKVEAKVEAAKPAVAVAAPKELAKPVVSAQAKPVPMPVVAPMKPVEEKKSAVVSVPVVAPVAKPVATPVSISAPIPVAHEPAKVPTPIAMPVAPVKPIAVPVAPVPMVHEVAKISQPIPVSVVAPKPVVVPVAMPSVKPLVPSMAVSPVVPAVPKPAQAQLKVEQKTVVKPESGATDKGNIFTSLFGKKEEMEPEKKTASVLETIVAKTTPVKSESKPKKVVEEGTGERMVGFANAFLQFSIAFILVSAGFLYVENLDTGNQVLSRVNVVNNAVQLHNAAVELDAKKEEERKLNLEIKKYQGGYEDDHRKTIATIVADRMDWTDLLRKLNEVTESVYEKNALSQYVQYNNYSYNAKTGQLTVSATLSDPLGKNLTKLAEIEEAFRNYPKDPENPKDERKPYFYGVQEFKSFTKNFNAATGRYQSQFSLALYTKEQSKKK
ncbi:hypothetical protein HZA44_02300 [Candidatus Peregrinibacteria bacterium]|nr:hypothetical protein [Candidatus Peregrinibacteria bacterium]